MAHRSLKADRIGHAVGVLLVCIIVATAAPRPAHARAGALDPTFASGGTVTTDFGTPLDQAYALAIQQDGMMVVAGTIGGDYQMPDRVAIARYRLDGSLDPSFGSGGKVTARFGSYGSAVRGLAIQPDGKIVVAGYTSVGGSCDFVLARYNRNGTPDAGFGAAGMVTTDFSRDDDRAFAVAIQADGRIVVAGYATVDGTRYPAVARYRRNGQRDNGFGNHGRVVSTEQAGELYALAIGPTDGKIVVAGTAVNREFFGRMTAVVARFSPDGSLDTEFGSAGFTFGPELVFNTVNIQSDDKIVAAGNSSYVGLIYAVMMRFGADGTVDTAFGDNGLVQTSFAGSSSWNEITDTEEGRSDSIVVGGFNYQKGPNSADFVLARYDRNGEPDAGFGDAGVVITDFAPLNNDFAYALSIQADGRVVLAGSSGDDFAIARYLVDDAIPVAADLCLHESGETVRVTIFSRPQGDGDPGFDATTLDPLTVTLTNTPVRTGGRRPPVAALADENGDGLLDMVIGFGVKGNHLSPRRIGSVAVLEGRTGDGRTIRGSAAFDLSRAGCDRRAGGESPAGDDR